ncbi:MAG: hypothetical protein LBI03_06880 [Clostridiales bacterium]|jgi:hypothetical protein|nr:hypothetical protein [Clostridiales bacterium]
MKNLKFIVLFAVIFSVVLTSCKFGSDKVNNTFDGVYAEKNGTYAATDDLGRTLAMPGDEGIREKRDDRYVGIFYFLWLEQNPNLYDISKIVAADPQAIYKPAEWGPEGAFHFWSEPLFGYYTSDDTWVMRKHVQMLTDAGVDFMVFDATNGYTYKTQALKMLSVLDTYQKQGWNVPKIAFYTNSKSGATINSIYKDIYMAHQEYSDLWFNWDGKPLIIGDPDDLELKQDAIDFFRIKHTQWPIEYNKDGTHLYHDDGFPWIDFEKPQHVYGDNEVMSVSVAQHNGSVTFSTSAFYGDDSNWTRSFHNGANDKSDGAVLYGYNFAEEFKAAIDVDPKIIFITGWNEWIAQRQAPRKDQPIVFVDTADMNDSRDIEPMKDGYGDNYYLEMCDYIRKYKGVDGNVDASQKISIDVNGDFTQWDQAKAVYTDYTDDVVDRKQKGWGKNVYTNDTGRNNFDTMKVTGDDSNLYFYVKTVDDISADTDPHWMNLFISTGGDSNWYGYDYVINRVSPRDGQAVLEKSDGGWSWSEAGTVSYKLEGNQMMLMVPKSLLEIDGDNVNIQFKWADNYQGEGDIWSFYSDGDVAPYGRMNYVYTNTK